MLNLKDIDETIEELENGATTMANCQKLAYLYIVRDKITKTDSDTVVQEYSDILPSYERYKTEKTKYQLGGGNKQGIINYLSLLCTEIEEFIKTLYSSTDTPEERAIIKEKITKISGEI